MKSIVFNTSGSQLSKRMEALTLKAGFILCDEVYSAGTTGIEMFFKETSADFPMEKKIGLLEAWHKKDEEALDMFQKAKEIMKLSRKTKHKQTDQIVFMKKMKKHIDDIYEAKVEEFEDYINEAGFQALKDLACNSTFKSYHCVGERESSPSGLKASSLLQRFLPSPKEDEEPEIFFLGNEFLYKRDENALCYEATSPEAADVQNTMLHCCFTFPNINALSASELETVHKQLFQSNTAFKESMDEWIDMCYFDDDTAERNNFFIDKVLVAASHLQEIIDRNEILTLCSRLQNNSVKLNVWLGEVPVWKLWEHYRHYETIKEETWQKLEALPEADAYRNKRWPIAVVSVPDQPSSDELDHDDADTEIKQTKKYLAID